MCISFNKVSRVLADLYTNLYNTYMGGLGQVPGKMYKSSGICRHSEAIFNTSPQS